MDFVSEKPLEFSQLVEGDRFVFIHDISLVESCGNLRHYQYLQVNEKTGPQTYHGRSNHVIIDNRKVPNFMCKKMRGACYPSAYVKLVT